MCFDKMESGSAAGSSDSLDVVQELLTNFIGIDPTTLAALLCPILTLPNHIAIQDFHSHTGAPPIAATNLAFHTAIVVPNGVPIHSARLADLPPANV